MVVVVVVVVLVVEVAAAPAPAASVVVKVAAIDTVTALLSAVKNQNKTKQNKAGEKNPNEIEPNHTRPYQPYTQPTKRCQVKSTTLDFSLDLTTSLA